MANIKKNRYNEIVTVNLSEKEIEAMKTFVLTKDRKRKVIDEEIDVKSCFSRCEWVRIAVKRLLLKEIKTLKELKVKEKEEDCKEFNHDHDDFVRIPIEHKGLENEPLQEYKTYKILKRLE